MISAVILAAGASRRMGRQKALLTLGGESFLKRIVNSIRVAAIEHVMVAIAHDDDKLREICELESIDVVVNTATPTAVPLGSIQAAVREIINRQVDSLLVWPVDQPRVSSATVSSLVSAFLRSGKAIALPVFDRKRGHPVLFGRSVFEELLTAPDSLGARTVVRSDAARVLEVPVTDSAVVEDINTPEAYQELVRRFDG